MLLVIFGLPFCVVSQLLQPTHPTAPFGEQPGGPIVGILLGPGGDPAPGQSIELQLVTPELQVTAHARTETDSSGEFSFHAPAFSGKYRLMFGGGTYRRAFREVGLVDASGEAEPVQDIELRLAKGAIVRLTFTRSDGRPVTGGRAILAGVTSDGPLFGLMGFPLDREVEFAGEICELDGLPPCSGDIQVIFTSGDTLETPFEAAVGTTELAFVL